MNEPLDIDLLYLEGCPSLAYAWSDLLTVVTRSKLEVRIRLVLVDSPETAERLQFAGSPTLKINGHDLEGYAGPGIMACRRYADNESKGWPSQALLLERLKLARL